jgi:aminocarboxymuconate-semialdehyde decarboxylase
MAVACGDPKKMAGKKQTTDRARMSGARGSGVAAIDTHAHWYPRELVSLLEREAAANGANMHRNDRGNAVFSLPGIAQVSTMVPAMIDLGLMLKAMDRRRIEVYTLSLTNPMVYWAPPAFGLKLAQTWNDACAAAHCQHPGRFNGTIMLPMQAPDLAVQELERAARLPGLRAVYLAEAINGRNLHDKSYWPVYERCEKLGLPILLHPLYPCGIERMGEFFLRNLLGNPGESGIAASCLIFGGVMDAFPKLKIVLPHGGGTFPWLIGRMDHGIKVRADLKHMKRPASGYLRRFYYDTITHHPGILRFLIDMVGVDRIVLGSDYNQDMSCQRPVDFVEKLPRLSKRERAMILGGNAARLLGL